jgi:hypothetical protein
LYVNHNRVSRKVRRNLNEHRSLTNFCYNRTERIVATKWDDETLDRCDERWERQDLR